MKIAPLVMEVPLRLVQWTPLIPQAVASPEMVNTLAVEIVKNPGVVKPIPVREIHAPIHRRSGRAVSTRFICYEAVGSRPVLEAARVAKLERIAVEVHRDMTDEDVMARYQLPLFPTTKSRRTRRVL